MKVNITYIKCMSPFEFWKGELRQSKFTAMHDFKAAT